jgi:predicted DNA-binding transcriptional regulator AlpA
MSEQYIDSHQARRKVGRGRTRFIELVNDPEANFPRPVEVFKNKHMWLESEIDAWMLQQPRIPLKPPSDTAKLLGRGRMQAEGGAHGR